MVTWEGLQGASCFGVHASTSIGNLSAVMLEGRRP